MYDYGFIKDCRVILADYVTFTIGLSYAIDCIHTEVNFLNITAKNSIFSLWSYLVYRIKLHVQSFFSFSTIVFLESWQYREINNKALPNFARYKNYCTFLQKISIGWLISFFFSFVFLHPINLHCTFGVKQENRPNFICAPFCLK